MLCTGNEEHQFSLVAVTLSTSVIGQPLGENIHHDGVVSNPSQRSHFLLSSQLSPVLSPDPKASFLFSPDDEGAKSASLSAIILKRMLSSSSIVGG